MNTEKLVRSEMLCFLQQKSNILAFDDLVMVCADFYSVDEVRMAASVLYKFVDQRPPAFKGSDKERKSTADMLKLILIRVLLYRHLLLLTYPDCLRWELIMWIVQLYYTSSVPFDLR